MAATHKAPIFIGWFVNHHFLPLGSIIQKWTTIFMLVDLQGYVSFWPQGDALAASKKMDRTDHEQRVLLGIGSERMCFVLAFLENR